MTLTLIMILITKALFWVSIKADIRSDYHTIKTGGIHHGFDMWQLIGVAGIIPMWFVDDLEMVILTVMSYGFMRAGMFNLGLNRLRDLKPWYLGGDWFDRLNKPLARWEENTRFPALTFAYWSYFAVGIVLGFFKITY